MQALNKAFKLPVFSFLPFISCKLSLPPFERDGVGIRCESCRFCTSRPCVLWIACHLFSSP